MRLLNQFDQDSLINMEVNMDKPESLVNKNKLFVSTFVMYSLYKIPEMFIQRIVGILYP